MSQNKIMKQDEAQKDRNGKAWVIEAGVLNKGVREYQGGRTRKKCLADELVKHMSICRDKDLEDMRSSQILQSSTTECWGAGGF